ncbi:MAG TPA: cysteine desulfurase family protein [Rhodocyclaceae bacterium]|nr:cysteine desulfurase family protein [Rhodocyclaceae bacterium]
MFAPVYLDFNASAPLDRRVLEAMLPFLTEQYGNASSRHEYGRAARDAIDRARQAVAAAFGAHATEVIFTSGGTEANNLLIKGAAANLAPGRLAVSAIEHPCVLEPARQLQRQGWQLDLLPVDGSGRLDRDATRAALAEAPALVSVMLANNETGVLQPVAEVAAEARAAGAIVHSDAVQAAGRVELDFRALNRAGLQAMTLSAHKIGGPQGAGALILNKRLDLQALLAGGGHERGLRSGTENVAAIVGFGKACELLAERLAKNLSQRHLRDRLEAALVSMGATIFGQGAERLSNTSYFAFAHLDGETLVGKLDRAGYAVASGSACSSAQPEPSHVLSAMGVAPELARGAVRLSLGPETSLGEIDGFVSALAATLKELEQQPRQTAFDALAA